MTDATQEEGGARSLFVNGEQLRQQIGRPSGGGGGEKYKPYTVEENAARLLTQLDGLRSAASAVPPERTGDQLVVEAQLHPQFLAASYFPAGLLQRIGATPLGTRVGRTNTRGKGDTVSPDQPTKSIYLATDASTLDQLYDIIQDPFNKSLSQKVREDIQTLDQIVLSSPRIDPDLQQDQPPLWEAVLHGRVAPSGRLAPASEQAVERWVDFIQDLGGEVEQEWIRNTESLTFAPVRMRPGLLPETGMFNGLRAIHALPTPRELPDAQELPSAFSTLDLPTPVTPGDPLRIAVFDGGVDDQQPVWASRVKCLTVGHLEGNLKAQRHGALVTSALLYGHAEGTALPAPANVLIDHFAVVPQGGPQSDLQMYWLLDVIEKQVRSGDYDVVVICFAPRQVVDDDHVDRWTSTIDTVSHEKNVLFVVAAGNNGELPAGQKLNRILVPADAANALAVGAATQPTPKANRAAYSAVGPGRAIAQVRPSGVAFGGTTAEPFIATDNDGAKLAFTGTSCAAPLVAYGLADLAARLGGENIDAVTMRAFAIHFANGCRRGEDPNAVGYGHFRDSYEVVTHCAPHEAHILYRGTIDRDEFIPLALPMPPGIAGRVRLRYTLATSSQIAETDPVDYTKAGLEIVLRPHSKRFMFSKNTRRKIVNVLTDADLAADLMKSGYTPSGEPVTLSLDNRPKVEAALRAEGKWDSIRVGERRFQKASALLDPRVELTYLARDQGTFVAAAHAPTLNWALLVTLQAETGIDLYQRVQSEFPVLTPVAVPTTATVATSVNAPNT